MPNLDILKQPLEFMVPMADRDTVYHCCFRAIGRPPKMDLDVNGAIFTFSCDMEMRAAETLVREVFAQEISISKNLEKLGAKDNQWMEWNLE